MNDLLSNSSMLLKRTLRAASGWMELGMPLDALAELSALSPAESETHQVLELRMNAQMALKKWSEAGSIAVNLCRQAADNPEFFLNAAFCLHETGDTAEAKNWLQRGPETLSEIPVYHYNMACYLWTLGEKERARNHLAKAIEMDEEFIESARQDSDLIGLDF